MQKRFVNIKTHTTNRIVTIILLSGFASSAISQNVQADVAINVHLRGVYESKINLIAMGGPNAFISLAEESIKNGETAKMKLSGTNLPGEFSIRFEFRESNGAKSLVAEKPIVINSQDLELWINPKYSDNPDSTWFQQGEKENTTYASFLTDNIQKNERLALLQQLLVKYDNLKSKFYQQAIEEYERQRQAYNIWLEDRGQKDRELFVSNLYRFNYVPQLSWEGTELQRLMNVISHYFDGIDFSKPEITKTFKLSEWMNNYVNLYLRMSDAYRLRDSLLSVAARTAIEKSKQGNALVYGWMVDYFYRGFESSNIPGGMKILETYLNDPNCLTSKRMEIESRLKGMKTLVVGSKAPNIEFKGESGNVFELYKFNPSSPLILLLFWSADCSHCIETVDALSPWLQHSENKQKISVVAVSLDATETEINAWEQKKEKLNGWKHLRAAEGFQSKAAKDYFILATPVMILLDGKTKNIVAMPASIVEIKNSIAKKLQKG